MHHAQATAGIISPSLGTPRARQGHDMHVVAWITHAVPGTATADARLPLPGGWVLDAPAGSLPTGARADGHAG